MNMPTILIVLGATGDLMQKKIVPALFKLYQEKNLPKLFKMIGFSRRNLKDTDFRDFVKTIIEETYSHDPNILKSLGSFLDHVTYQQGHLENLDDYHKLARVLGYIDKSWAVCANKLFYLAVPPTAYEPILNNLSVSGLTIPCSDDTGWTRVLVEKPFGKDLKSSEDLDKLLSTLFREEQIYRIDHYLGKDMIQNILQFRFANNLFEDSWNNTSVEKVDIRLHETIGVEKRGTFYDGVGALRDVGQNHILQMLALIAMDAPRSFDPTSIRESRAKILEKLPTYTLSQAAENSFRGQYRGYTDIAGVDNDSKTETYFKIKTFINSERWKGVPFTLESGKRLGKSLKEIVVTFKHPSPCLCKDGKHSSNQIIFRLEPKEEILVSLYAKKPGIKNEIEEKKIHFVYREEEPKVRYIDAYEKLLYDAIEGDQTLFASSREVASMWSFTDSFVEAWTKDNAPPLEIYEPDTSEIIKKSSYIDSSKSNDIPLAKNMAVLGLGKMGAGIALRLLEKGWQVHGYNRTKSVTDKLAEKGLVPHDDIVNLVKSISSPRILWLMLPAGKVVDDTLEILLPHLSNGDIVIDGGNSYYKDSVRRGDKLKSVGVHFVDIGVSGGPSGARHGACLMVGGAKDDFLHLEPLIQDVSARYAYGYFGKSGAGHFVKMIHNGIEYGMMQSIAEGAMILKNSDFDLDLAEVFRIYNARSVIESRLVGWTHEALLDDPELTKVSAKIKSSGEGEWTIKTAHEMGLDVPVIEKSFDVRQESETVASDHPSAFRNKVVSAQRHKFGQHDVSVEQ